MGWSVICHLIGNCFVFMRHTYGSHALLHEATKTQSFNVISTHISNRNRVLKALSSEKRLAESFNRWGNSKPETFYISRKKTLNMFLVFWSEKPQIFPFHRDDTTAWTWAPACGTRFSLVGTCKLLRGWRQKGYTPELKFIILKCRHTFVIFLTQTSMKYIKSLCKLYDRPLL